MINSSNLLNPSRIISHGTLTYSFFSVCFKSTRLISGCVSYRFSGLTEEMLRDVTTTLEDVQKDLSELIDYQTILLGHSLESDLRVLKVRLPSSSLPLLP